MAKNRYMFITAFLLCCLAFESANSSKCDRTPVAVSASKSPPDGRFRLHIKSTPARYVPNEEYEITLEAIQRNSSQQLNTFTGFYLTVEKDFTDTNLAPMRPIDIKNMENSVGRFELVPEEPAAKISDRCNNLVTHTTTVAVQSVQVRWIAPGNGSGCVVFKSTIIERRDVWFADEGPLIAKLCEDAEDSGDVQPLVLDECKACKEAKYELTIERMWSKHTHPKDFPIGWDTKFGDIIGASHPTNFSMWTYGEKATQGMENLALHGATEDLEKELMSDTAWVRTIIKARGIAHPDINGQTHAVFRVDKDRHLITLASQIYPSPDWFIGVSALELCTFDGGWVEHKEMNLYPFDGGVDNGPTYTSPDQPTKPQEAIRRIKPNQPNDIRSPFHDTESKSMKPMAKLIISLQRLYDNNCVNQLDEKEEDGEEEENEAEDEKDEEDNRASRGGSHRGRAGKAQDDEKASNHCEVSEWTKWSDCGGPCENKTRTREFTSKATQNWLKKNCENVELVDEMPCSTNQKTRNDCNKPEGEIDLDGDEGPQLKRSDCPLSDWSAYSECSKSCGKGEMTRTREFTNRKNRDECKKVFADLNLHETKTCEGEDCGGDIGETRTEKSKKSKCPAPANFGKWSECSEESCGIKVRVKDVSGFSKALMKDENIQKLANLFKRVKNSKKKLKPEEYEMIQVEDEEHPCNGVDLMEAEPCEPDNPECDTFCSADPPIENCNVSVAEPRWFYIKDKGVCGIFTYRGCEDEGMKNSFFTEEECMHECENKPTSDAWQSFSLVKHHNEVNSRVDCTVSQWKQQPCNATCSEDGLKWRYRTIIQNARNGGLPCPRTIAQMERCWKNCDDDSEEMSIKVSSSNGRAVSSNRQHHRTMMTTTTTTQRSTFARSNQQRVHCQYSEWSPWSPCSKTCGDYSVQIRARTVLDRANAHMCTDRLQERSCDVMPCMITRYNYRGFE